MAKARPEELTGGVPLPAGHRLDSGNLRGGKGPGAALVSSMADPTTEMEPALHMFGSNVRVMRSLGEESQVTQAIREECIQRAP